MREELEYIESGLTDEDTRNRMALAIFFMIVHHDAFAGNPKRAMREAFNAANEATKLAEEPVESKEVEE